MGPFEIITALLVAAGAGIMLLGIVATRRLIAIVEGPAQQRRWRLLFVLMVFFLLAYLGAILLVLGGAEDIFMALTGVVFFFGAVFVFAVATLGRSTIADLIATTVAKESVETILNSMADSVIVLDNDGLICQVNAATCRLLSVKEEEIIGQPMALYLAPRRKRRTTRLIDVSEVMAGVRAGLDATYLDATGKEIPMSLSSSTIHDRSGEVAGVICVAQDNRRRREAERMKEEFVSVVSHELKTPMTAIRGALGLLVGGKIGEVDPRQRQMLEVAYANTERLVRLVNDTLDYEKLAIGKMTLQIEPLDPGGIMEQAVAGLGVLASDRGVSVQCHVDEAPIAHGDADRIIQVLTNLIGNAISFSPPNGEVSVRALPGQELALRFEVVDRGAGIPKESHNRLFRRFEQLDSSDTRRPGGTGLGLAISKAIIDSHGGLIGVDSDAGKGATFFFELPPEPSAQLVGTLTPDE